MKPYWRVVAFRAATALLLATLGTALIAAGNPPAEGVAGPSGVYVDPVPVWLGLVALVIVAFMVRDQIVAARSRSTAERAAARLP